MGFSIPVAMLEQDPEGKTWFDRLGYTLFRSVSLARAEYLHAMGISAALVIVYVVLGIAWVLPLMPLIQWMQRPDPQG